MDAQRGLYTGRQAHTMAVSKWMLDQISDAEKLTELHEQERLINGGEILTILCMGLIDILDAYDVGNHSEASKGEYPGDCDSGAHW